AGITAQYVQGTLSTARSQQVIRSMFPNQIQVLGCLAPGAQRADPVNDPTLLAEAADHYWVEFGPGFTPADPTFSDASIGQVFATAQQRFTDIPASLRHTVTIRIDAETFSQIGAALGVGGGFSTFTPLNVELATADVFGHPISVAFNVSATA